MRTLGALALLLLTGCATAPPDRYVWHNANVDNQTAQIQAMQCEQYAAQVAPHRAQTFAPRSGVTSFMYGERAAQFEAAHGECMQRMGYQLIRIGGAAYAPLIK